MTRTAAREIAVHFAFELGFTNQTAEELLEALNRETFEQIGEEEPLYAEFPNEKQREYICKLVKGVYEHSPELDEYISKYAIGWKYSRLNRVAIAIMRVAMCEILYMQDIPNAAAINEAVEMTKHYEEPEVVSFVNGILGSFVRNECPPEPVGLARGGAAAGRGVICAHWASTPATTPPRRRFLTAAAGVTPAGCWRCPRELGLRQSDALFQHVKRLPGRLPAAGAVAGRAFRRGGQHPAEGGGGLLYALLFGGGGQGADAGGCAGRAVLPGVPPAGAHRRRRLVGGTAGAAGPAPCWRGICPAAPRAAAGGAGRGQCRGRGRIGGTSDISAGQLIDRTGVLLGLPFPAGRRWTPWRRRAERDRDFPVKLNGLTFSLSGWRTRLRPWRRAGRPPAGDRLVYPGDGGGRCRPDHPRRPGRWPGLPVLCSGGVASNRLPAGPGMTDACLPRRSIPPTTPWGGHSGRVLGA